MKSIDVRIQSRPSRFHDIIAGTERLRKNGGTSNFDLIVSYSLPPSTVRNSNSDGNEVKGCATEEIHFSTYFLDCRSVDRNEVSRIAITSSESRLLSIFYYT